MKIVVTGTRGIPEIQGGVETHCQELYPRIAAMGHDVTVLRRKSYTAGSPELDEYRGVHLADVYSPHTKTTEAIVHTFLCVLKARRMHADILHIHAVGPSVMTPLARLLGLKVVTTNHGPDYDRQKWGRLAKFVLRAGERMGALFSNKVIVISETIAGILARNYGRKDTVLIYNGVNRPEIADTHDYTDSLGLMPGKYIVAIGRLVEEKGFHDLIEAYAGWKGRDRFRLVIAGDADHRTAYSDKLRDMASRNDVVMTGFIRGEKMRQIMSHAALFAMPSYHEGLPIALLEAMSYNLDVAVSNIPANRLNILSDNDFFAPGDTEGMRRVLTAKLEAPQRRSYDLSAYDWDHIARQTEAVYRSIASDR